MKTIIIALAIFASLAGVGWADTTVYGGFLPATCSGGTCTPTVGLKNVEVSCTTDATLAPAQVSGTILNSYGRTGAVTDTLPTAGSGMSFMRIVGTQHNSAWKLQRGGTDTMIVDGVAGKTYVQETNQAVGSAIVCQTFKTGANAWTWMCSTISGTWVTD